MLAYALACSAALAILIFLKWCEGSPVRSWKAVFFIAVPLGFAGGYYYQHVLASKQQPVPQAQKTSAYKAELERTFRRIDGVESADITGSMVRINFAQEKPLSDLKNIARQCGGTASSFLQTGVTVHITVGGQDRYEMEYDRRRGVTREQTF